MRARKKRIRLFRLLMKKKLGNRLDVAQMLYNQTSANQTARLGNMHAALDADLNNKSSSVLAATSSIVIRALNATLVDASFFCWFYFLSTAFRRLVYRLQRASHGYEQTAKTTSARSSRPRLQTFTTTRSQQSALQPTSARMQSASSNGRL